MIEPKFLKSETHIKKWGNEVWVCNNNEFCGKVLNIYKGKSFSFHFHINKREVFWVFKSKLEFEYLDLENADRKCVILIPGDVVEIPRNLPHKLTALEDDAQIIEFSTHHEDSDSYRIEKGDSQK